MQIRVSAAERRARLVQRHRLGMSGPAGTESAGTESAGTESAGTESVTKAVDSLVALHATDPVSVYLSAWARTGCAVDHVDEALYTDRTLVRMLGMRRTMFVVPAELVGVVQAACTDDVARRLRRQLEKHLTDGGIGDGDAAGWLRSVEAGVLHALEVRGGGASGAQLSEDEPRLRTQLVYSADKAYGGPANITSRVLGLLAADGHLIRGHRRGGWSSGQFEWFLADMWLSHGTDAARTEPGAGVKADAARTEPGAGVKADAARAAGPGAGVKADAARAAGPGDGIKADAARAAEPGDGIKADAARAELARRWLVAFGPAPVSDLQWWAGWTAGQTKAALAALPVVEVDLDGQAGVGLADDLDFPASVPPAAALLPALDPTPMGWQERSWYLGPHAPTLFDRTGNVGPTVWWAGRVVGGWAQRASGEVTYRLLEDTGSDGEAAVAAQAARLQGWLGPSRVTPRFRTPLERELSA